MSEDRASQGLVEVLHLLADKVDASQALVEALYTLAGQVKSSQGLTEVLHILDGQISISQTVIEVYYVPGTPQMFHTFEGFNCYETNFTAFWG